MLMAFQEVFDNNVTLPGDVVFDVWKQGNAATEVPSIPEEIARIVKAGHRVVLANGNSGEWYLNDGWGNGNDGGRYRSSWKDVYGLDPRNPVR